MNTPQMFTSVATTAKKTVWHKHALSVEGLSISVGGKPLISIGDFTVSVGDRIGLLGRNGCGKSTLFQYISNLNTSEPVDVPWSIYEVMQEMPSTEQSITNVVLAAHLERGELWIRRATLESIEDLSETELAEYNTICERLVSIRADADPPRAKSILVGLGFTTDQLEMPLNTFSGGWKARVALACGLFMEPDLLLLDEPTNHLDLNAVLWLSEFCKAWKRTLIVITHNSYFAHSVCTSIFHIHNKNINTYKGDYAKFLKMKAQMDEKLAKDWEKLEKEVIRIKSSGTPKSKTVAEELLAKKAREGVTKPLKTYKPRFLFSGGDETASSVLLGLTDVAFSYNNETAVDMPILQDVNYALYPGTRSVLVGANGSGKSTLLKLLIGNIVPNTGTCSRRAGLSVKYFNQHFYNDLPAESTPVAYVGSQTIDSRIDNVRRILGATGLGGESHLRPIGTLSGGEKARVYFAGLVISQPDILLLDEPTNHLDMETTEGLIEGLKTFPGAIVIVSHDLEFLEELGTEVWLIEDQQVKRLGEGIDGLDVYVKKVMNAMTA